MIGDNSMRINIAGAFSKNTEIRLYIARNKQLIRKFNLTVYDGINNCPWNGGRVNRDIIHDDETIDFYYRNNISIALTFTNPIVNVNDRIGNELLKKFHNHGNIIISVSEELRDYIKDTYPYYKHTRSITAFGKINVPMSDAELQMYKDYEHHYDYIVPRCEHVFDERFTGLNQSKYEIMLNDTCIYNCPYYDEHFRKIAEQNRRYKKPWEEAPPGEMYNIEECWLSDRSDYKNSDMFDMETGDKKAISRHGDNYGMDLKVEQIKRLVSQGISNFKISGREMSFEDFNSELNRYLIDIYN